MRRLLALVLALILTLSASALAESFFAVVTANKTTIYADEGFSWAMGTLSQGALVTVDSYSGNVAQITKNGRSGYARVKDLFRITGTSAPRVVSTDTLVYRMPNLNAQTARVKQGLSVNLLMVNGRWAMVERNGTVGYMNKNELREPSVTDDMTPAGFSAIVTAERITVYKTASAASLSLGSLKKGKVVNVIESNNTWAYIELNGNKGYAFVSGLERYDGGDAATPTAKATATPAPATATPSKTNTSFIKDTSLSVEYRIYLFMTRVMGLTSAAACAVLSNVERECDFNINDLSYDGGYGIVQWTATRNTNLKNWCRNNGYSHTTLEGQLWFLKYELETTQTKTLTKLRNTPNTPAGAYDAAYYFCYYFEIPVNRAANAARRGALARDKYWPKYN